MPIHFDEVSAEIAPPPRERGESERASAPQAVAGLPVQIRAALEREQRRRERLSAE